MEQRFWVVGDEAILAAVVEAMEPKRNLIIADGHHRTRRAQYRTRCGRSTPSIRRGRLQYVMATFVSMSDPGLVILPTHRLIQIRAD